MARAWANLSKCMRPHETGVTNEFFLWIDNLDWTDAWYTYTRSRWELTWINKAGQEIRVSYGFTPIQLADFKKDAAWWSLNTTWLWRKLWWIHRPWVSWNKLDIDKNWIHIKLWADWQVVKDAEWNALYVYNDTWEVVDWSKIKDKKEKVLFFFSRVEKKMASAPSWYMPAKDAMLWYVPYLRKHHATLMTADWFDLLEREIENFFYNIEKWDMSSKWWFNIIYSLFDSWFWNHWYLMSKIMPRTFDRMLSDREVNKQLLWYDFSDVTFREFAESAAVYANKARWWNITVVDAMWTEYADRIYWKKAMKLFWENEEWKMERLETPVEWTLNKDYFMKLSIDQQIEQIRSYLWKDMPSINKFSQYIKIKLRYNWRWKLLRLINAIWKPSLYSALMSFWKWLSWFMPLLILNSGMFVTDLIARWVKLNWDWKWLFNKWWLDDWLPKTVKWYSSWIWNTPADLARDYYGKAMDALNQWLFNIWDLMMENSYKVRQYQAFFQAQFPWIKDVWEIDRILENMELRDPDQLNRLLEAARQYSEYSIRLSTTNTPIMSSLVRVHAAKNPLNQPMLDTWYVMWNFFSGWWYNKLAWAWKILKDWMSNVYHWRIWAKYVDDLIWTQRLWLSPTEAAEEAARIRWSMVRSYLENEQMIYFFHKLYTAMMIWKYLDRLTEDNWEKNTETIFDDLSDMMSFMDIFSWDYAALTANPQWRIVKNFFDMFIWELENNQSLWTATKAATAAATKEAFRSFFRKLYLPQIATEYFWLQNANWDTEEWAWLRMLTKSIQDNVNWYMYYLKDQTENWEYWYYTPRWPNSYVNSILGISPKSVEFVNDQKMLSKLANLSWWLFEDWTTFHNWVIYSFPFLKQYNMAQIAEVKWFVDDYDAFRATREYNQMVNWEIPSWMRDTDWEYLYDITTRRLINDEDKISNLTFQWSYDFVWDDWSKAYDKNRQTQEYIIHKFMTDWLSEEQAKELVTKMQWKTNRFDEEAIRTLAYMEAKTPGSSLQAVAYLMSQEWYNYVYRSWTRYEWEALEARKKQWEIVAAQKYSEYLPYVDRYLTWPQFILYYAKMHDTTLAKYISWPWDKNAWSMKLITPWWWVDENWNQYQNSMLKQNFQAQLMVDIEWANWNPNARKLMNWFATIFDTKKYENPDWSLDPKYAAYALDQIEIIYNHIDRLAMDENSKRVLKQWALMFWDKLFTNIMNDEKLMQREDVQTMLKDWAHYWYGEFRELDEIAIEAAEDQISNNEWKAYWAKKNYLTSWINKKFPWFVNRYDYMKNRAYSNNYIKYRIFDWTPRDHWQNYLSKLDYNTAKIAQWWRTQLRKTSSGKFSKQKDDWIWVSTRRGKAIQFYKREDIDKPVEYRTPWRKRWVRRWSWVKPISPTVWKHLTPKPKTNG